MGGGGTTQTQTVDPRTAGFINQARRRVFREAGAPVDTFGAIPGLEHLAGLAGAAGERGLGGVDAFLDPYLESVVGATQSDFDRLRRLASRAAGQEATAAGAFGGSRHGVLEASRLRGLDEQEIGTLARLRSAGFQSASDRLLNERARLGQFGLAGLTGLQNFAQLQQAQRLGALGLLPSLQTPISQTTEQRKEGPGLLGTITGLGSIAAGALLPGVGPALNTATSLLKPQVTPIAAAPNQVQGISSLGPQPYQQYPTLVGV